MTETVSRRYGALRISGSSDISGERLRRVGPSWACRRRAGCGSGSSGQPVELSILGRFAGWPILTVTNVVWTRTLARTAASSRSPERWWLTCTRRTIRFCKECDRFWSSSTSRRVAEGQLALLQGQSGVPKGLGDVRGLEIGCSTRISSTDMPSATIATTEATGNRRSRTGHASHSVRIHRDSIEHHVVGPPGTQVTPPGCSGCSVAFRNRSTG